MPSPPTDPEGKALLAAFLSDEEQRAWLGMLETHDALMRSLEAVLSERHSLTLSAFEALIRVAHAPEHRITVSALAGQIMLSSSRVSRLVIDLERRGLLMRERSERDWRATDAVLTAAGRDQLRDAAPSYLEVLRSQWLGNMSAKEVAAMAASFERARRGREGRQLPRSA